MTAIGSPASLEPSYWALVKAFPLTKIRDDAHLHQALQVLDGLMSRRRDHGEEVYLDALAVLVEAYEADLPGFDAAALPDLLHVLMESNGDTQTTLAAKAGVAKSLISELLQGKRKITLQTARKIAKAYALPVAVLLQSDE